MNKPGGTCTETDEPIQPAGTLAGVAQCASCYLEGRSEPCYLVALSAERKLMADSDLRALERKAAGGSLREQAALIRALVRSGSPLPPILESPKPDDVWICKDGSYGCTIRHRSERTSLVHCGKLERKAECALSFRFARFLPHRIECHSLIYGTSYPCDCGALRRSSIRSLLPLERAEYADLLADGMSPGEAYLQATSERSIRFDSDPNR